MSLPKQFTDTQLTRILDQSLLYQCACPAQVCRTLMTMRELHDYQLRCIDRNETDRKVHALIAESTAACHRELESCLAEILALEGWDIKTLEMPEALRKLQDSLI